MVDYGTYMVLRHQPLILSETKAPLKGSAKKEQLRTSLDRCDEYISKRNEEANETLKKQKEGKKVYAIVNKKVDIEGINEVKKELGKLHRDFVNCKTLLDNSLSEVKTIMKKINEKAQSSQEQAVKAEVYDLPRKELLRKEESIEEKVMHDLEDVKKEINAQEFGISEYKTIEQPINDTIKEQYLPKEEEDINLARTDHFILEKFEKIQQVKNLLKTLNP